uniref:Gfo/Idh/MocA-like oxidoreductase N-terminal domain-containing protein n=1 Tax=Alexandrium monilatum TaxID=311494 RepID=A0A7S4VCI2_9DINO
MATEDAEPPSKKAKNGEARGPPGCLMMGTGEYTTGFVGGKAADSDKSTGVVGLVCLDLRMRGKLGRLGMCGVNGKKFPAIRAHMKRVLGDVYEGIDPSVIETFPEDGVVDPQSFRPAAGSFQPGDCAIIFTPDDTHLEIALACIERGMHVLITKPPVKTLEDHRTLMAAAAKHNVLVQIEVHKRFDPIYLDACDRIQNLGPFSYFTSYMSQPKHQLETFKAWAGKSSDISYYLNSHHVDFHVWTQRGRSRPVTVTALGSTGVAEKRLDGVKTEDTITLTVQWQNLADGSLGHALYTSSWVAPKSDVHSQQRWFYMGQKGEVTVDQAHRGYTVATDEAGFGNVNPLFWKPAPTNGRFTAQRCYGYISFESFVEAAHHINLGKKSPADFDHQLPTIHTTVAATAILEAGKRSLDAGGRPMQLTYDSEQSVVPSGIAPKDF